MLEVELKFILTEKEKMQLLEEANFIEEQNFIDIYYDDKIYSLSTNDIWLRSRNDKFVLKLPIASNNISLKKQRNSPKLEIEREEDILKHLKIQKVNSFKEDLSTYGIFPLYKFRNIRQKYAKKDFIIDIDTAIFDDFTYETCEIEMVVNSENEIDHAIKSIESFAKLHEIKINHVEGRLIELIRRKNPEHYQKLLHARGHDHE